MAATALTDCCDRREKACKTEESIYVPTPRGAPLALPEAMQNDRMLSHLIYSEHPGFFTVNFAERKGNWLLIDKIDSLRKAFEYTK